MSRYMKPILDIPKLQNVQDALSKDYHAQCVPQGLPAILCDSRYADAEGAVTQYINTSDMTSHL